MDEDALNMSIRRFLKTVGVTSQREIEKAVRAVAETGVLDGAALPVRVRLTIEAVGLDHAIDGEIDTGPARA
ncbi:MAG: hypothetical protein HOK81_03250 [Rhodospirillaceae bacterium]|nr:hypothetical protein [Rhodospirillaceae bacterium]